MGKYVIEYLATGRRGELIDGERVVRAESVEAAKAAFLQKNPNAAICHIEEIEGGAA